MKNQYPIVLLLILVFNITSCKKGDTGSAGPQGPKGDIGAVGADGTKIFSGQGAPATTLGKNGDFYIDFTTSNMYGPKADAGWGTPYSLKGANGTNGNPGSKIYSGTGAPASNIGIAGDYFMSTDTYLFYGPKTEAGWGTPVNLKGPKGDKGDPGQATVVSTPWMKIAPSEWSVSGLQITHKYQVPQNLLSTLGVSSLTDFIKIKNGIVLGYMSSRQSNGTTKITTLPTEFPTKHSIDFQLYIGSATPDFIQLTATDNVEDAGWFFDLVSNSYTYQFVFIPTAQVMASGAAHKIKINNQIDAQQQLQSMSYAQVAQLFNLKN